MTTTSPSGLPANPALRLRPRGRRHRRWRVPPGGRTPTGMPASRGSRRGAAPGREARTIRGTGSSRRPRGVAARSDHPGGTTAGRRRRSPSSARGTVAGRRRASARWRAGRPTSARAGARARASRTVVEGGAPADRLHRPGLPGQLEGPGRGAGGVFQARGPTGRRPARPPGAHRRRRGRGARSAACCQRNSAASATSRRLVEDEERPRPRWSRPLAGARIAAQTSAASPTSRARAAPSPRGASAAPAGAGRRRSRGGRGRRQGAPAAGRPGVRAGRDLAAPSDGSQELAGRQERRPARRPDACAGPWVEEPERVDLVAEELDPDGELGAGREDVDEAAAAGDLAAAGHLGARARSRARGAPEERVLEQPVAGPERARRGRQVVAGERRLEQRLDGRDEDARAAGPPGGEGGDARGGLVADQLAPLVGERGPRLEDRDGAGSPSQATSSSATRSPISASRAIQQSRAPAGQREGGREERLGAVRHGRDRGMATAGTGRGAARRACRAGRGTGAVPSRRGGSTARSGTAGGARRAPAAARSRRGAAGPARTSPGRRGPLTSLRPSGAGGSGASPSACAGRRRARAARPPRPAARCASRRRGGAGTR